MPKTDILSLGLGELTNETAKLGEQKFRAKQIYNWLHVKKVTEFSQMTNLSENLRNKLDEHFYITNVKVLRKLVSKDGTVKYLFALPDGTAVESVVMNYKHGNSLCISTQVGCKMGCSFCASTIAGFERHLSPSEMLSQVYYTHKIHGISSIVLMGIGEPLDNFDNVIKFLNLLSDGNGHNMSLRHVSLSTCGLVPKIYELGELDLGLTLSISLHAPNDELRKQIMPIANKYSVSELITACKDYFDTTGRRISFEYSLIDGVNDTSECARQLSKLLHGFNCHVNLIPVNEVKERSYKSSKIKSVENFKDILVKSGINATVRRTLGNDISAACGQLRKDHVKKEGLNEDCN